MAMIINKAGLKRLRAVYPGAEKALETARLGILASLERTGKKRARQEIYQKEPPVTYPAGRERQGKKYKRTFGYLTMLSSTTKKFAAKIKYSRYIESGVRYSTGTIMKARKIFTWTLAKHGFLFVLGNKTRSDIIKLKNPTVIKNRLKRELKKLKI